MTYAHEHGCPWDKNTCLNAVYRDHLECLIYAHKNGCSWESIPLLKADPWDTNTYSTYKDGINVVYKNDTSIIFNNAVNTGNVEILEYIFKNDINNMIFKNTYYLEEIKKNSLNVLKFLIKNICNLDNKSCETFAKRGNLECLKYAHENGCQWNEKTCENAAGNKSIECLKYAHENGCPWDKAVIENKGSYLECIKYAHENGCPWDKCTTKIFIKGKKWKHLEYAHDNGCPSYRKYNIPSLLIRKKDKRFNPFAYYDESSDSNYDYLNTDDDEDIDSDENSF